MLLGSLVSTAAAPTICCAKNLHISPPPPPVPGGAAGGGVLGRETADNPNGSVIFPAWFAIIDVEIQTTAFTDGVPQNPSGWPNQKLSDIRTNLSKDRLTTGPSLT